MAKAFTGNFYLSKAWRECRHSFICSRILVDGGLCEDCQRELGYIVHHIKEITPENIGDINITLNHKNLKYLCKNCHEKYRPDLIKREVRYVFGEDGEVLPPIAK